MKTSKNYSIENVIISKNTNILLQEGFSEKYIPEAVNKITNILNKRLGVSIGIDPFPMFSNVGGTAYKVVLDEDLDYSTFSFEFNNGNLNRIGYIGNYEDNTITDYLDLQGYNIVQVIDEIEAVFTNYLNNGIFNFPDDYFDEKEELLERVATASNAFDIWIKENKREAQELLVNERLINVYRNNYMPWADNNDDVEGIMSNVSFFNLAKKWLKANKLENIYAHKSLIINTKGKLEYVESTVEEKNWRKLITLSYEDQFELMNQMVDGVVSGGLNAIAIFGPPGVGKTYGVRKHLDSIGTEYFTVTGAIKDVRALVQVLYAHKDNEIIIFDDLDITNKAFREIVLAACDDKDDREIAYFDTKAMNAPKTKKIDEVFTFTSGVIYISNKPKIDPALKSRAITLEITLSPEEKMSLIFNSLADIAPAIPMDIKEEVFEFLIESIKELNLIDYRKYKQSIALYTLYKGDESKWKPSVLRILK